MRIVMDDTVLNQWARDFYKETTKIGTPIQHVMTFEEYIEKRKRKEKTA